MTMTMTTRYGSLSTFTFDLTWDQRQLCAWVAEQASSGIRRVQYDDAKAVLGIASDWDITCLLKEIRERIDDVHEMVQFPIVNTSRPYFDIHGNAGYIWDDYCRAEQEIADPDFENRLEKMGVIHHSGYGRAACAV